MIRSSILDPNFNVLFPHQTFPWRLDLKDVVCHFECEEHLQKYLDRYKLKPKDYKVSNRDGKSLKSSKKHKRSVESGTTKKSNRSSSTIRKRTSILDPTGNFTSNAKRK